jgi:hypothetical protein
VDKVPNFVSAPAMHVKKANQSGGMNWNDALHMSLSIETF